MLSSVLRSRRAIEANAAAVRAFVRLRELIDASPRELPRLPREQRPLGCGTD